MHLNKMNVTTHTCVKTVDTIDVSSALKCHLTMCFSSQN